MFLGNINFWLTSNSLNSPNCKSEVGTILDSIIAVLLKKLKSLKGSSDINASKYLENFEKQGSKNSNWSAKVSPAGLFVNNLVWGIVGKDNLISLNKSFFFI